MKRTPDDGVGARPRIFVPRPDYRVRWPSEAPYVHEEDKALLRDLVQFVEERVATRTVSPQGPESAKASTAFDYVIRHAITDVADYYMLEFRLPYNVVESSEDVLMIHGMCHNCLGSMDRSFNLPAERHELLIKVRSSGNVVADPGRCGPSAAPSPGLALPLSSAPSTRPCKGSGRPHRKKNITRVCGVRRLLRLHAPLNGSAKNRLRLVNVVPLEMAENLHALCCRGQCQSDLARVLAGLCGGEYRLLLLEQVNVAGHVKVPR